VIDDVYFLTVEEVVAIHADQVTIQFEIGGAAGAGGGAGTVA